MKMTPSYFAISPASPYERMLDELASSVTELKESTTELKESMTELRESMTELRGSTSELRGSTSELRESVTEVKDGIDGLRITAQALLQVAAQSQRDMELIKERQAESDQRFNVLLEEVRYLNRGNRES
jgi:methyl-accepting chemotaxis protein